MNIHHKIARFSRTNLLLPRQQLSLKKADPVIYSLIQEEIQRQRTSVNLIPSENHSSKAVLEALGSVMSTKYAEGTTPFSSSRLPWRSLLRRNSDLR